MSEQAREKLTLEVGHLTQKLAEANGEEPPKEIQIVLEPDGGEKSLEKEKERDAILAPPPPPIVFVRQGGAPLEYLFHPSSLILFSSLSLSLFSPAPSLTPLFPPCYLVSPRPT